MDAAEHRVVVGVDGSAGSRTALAWALAEAARRGAVVDVVCAFPVDVYWLDPLLLDSARIDAVRADTAARAAAVVEEVRRDPAVASHPGVADLDVRVQAVAAPAAPKLVQLSAGADLLVVGHRGHGPIRSAVGGSVALHCAAHASCPVVVVHPTTEPEEPPRIVVGLDDSTQSRAALAVATAHAAGMGARVDAVVAYERPVYWAEPYTEIVLSPEETHARALARGQEIVAETLGASATDAVRVRAVEGHPVQVLLDESAGARLLVVGSRSHHSLQGIALGSVALACVTTARCPVLVVRPSPDRREQADTATAPTAAFTG